MPRIALCGGFRIGVDISEPNTPPLVIVKCAGQLFERRPRAFWRTRRPRFDLREARAVALRSTGTIKACIEALRRFPVVNASVDGNDIVYHEYYDIGDRGLDRSRPDRAGAARRRPHELRRHREDASAPYAKRARDGAITLEELKGGTFTITNGGVFGSLMSTPILNPPQSAILGMHKIQERPIVVDGQVVVRPMMYLALTYDHRIIDGREAVQFLVAIKEALEDPRGCCCRSENPERVSDDRPASTSIVIGAGPAGYPARSAPRRTSSRSPASTTGRTATAATPSAAPA